MGSKSSPQQSTATSNTSISYGLQDSTGVFGNSNNITYNMADGGLVQGVTDIAKSGFEYMTSTSRDLTQGLGRLIGGVEYTVGEMGDLTLDAIAQNSNLSRDAIASGNDLALNLGMENAKMARDSMLMGGELFNSFAQELNAARQDSTQAVIDQGRYALQYADNASRSDGQQLALDTNKRMMYVLLGGIGLMSLAIYATNR